MAKHKKRRGSKKRGMKLAARTRACGRQWKAKSKKFRSTHKWTAFLKGGKGKCKIPKR